MFGVGTPELIIIALTILLLFGGKKLPEISKSLGQAVKELRHGFTDNLNEPTKKRKASKVLILWTLPI